MENGSKYNHIILDFENCESEDLSNLHFLKNVLFNIVKKHKLNVIGLLNKKFKPQGATIILQLEESHITIHTCPEYKKVLIDIFTDVIKDEKEIVKFLEKQFKGKCNLCVIQVRG